MFSRIHGAEYKDIKRLDFRSDGKHDAPSFYLDYISRTSDTKIVGRGVAMTAASTCSHCGKQGHYARNCWKRKDDSGSKSTGAHKTCRITRDLQTARRHPTLEQSTKWCSVHQDYLSRRHGKLQARSATPTAEWTRSHCLCCTGREHTPLQRRRKAVPQLRRRFRRGIRVYRAARW